MRVVAVIVIAVSFVACHQPEPTANATDPYVAPPAPSGESQSADAGVRRVDSGAQEARDGNDDSPGETMKIRMVLEDEVLTATLDGGAAARDFAALLPLTLTLKDYADTEKVSDLPARLSTEGEPEGIDPDVGDITYYAPWGNLAIFYRDFGYAKGLVKLGRIDAGVEKLASKSGEFTVRLELVERP